MKVYTEELRRRRISDEIMELEIYLSKMDLGTVNTPLKIKRAKHKSYSKVLREIQKLRNSL